MTMSTRTFLRGGVSRKTISPDSISKTFFWNFITRCYHRDDVNFFSNHQHIEDIMWKLLVVSEVSHSLEMLKQFHLLPLLRVFLSKYFERFCRCISWLIEYVLYVILSNTKSSSSLFYTSRFNIPIKVVEEAQWGMSWTANCKVQISRQKWTFLLRD